MMKWYMKWIIYELRIWNQVKLWSSQLWAQFLQLRREAWKIQDFNRVWTLLKSWLFQASLRNCKNCAHNCEDHSFTWLLLLLHIFLSYILEPASVLIAREKNGARRSRPILLTRLASLRRLFHFQNTCSIPQASEHARRLCLLFSEPITRPVVLAASWPTITVINSLTQTI